MDEQERDVNRADSNTSQEPILRPWIRPSFERVPLNEALSAIKGMGMDFGLYS